MSHKSSSQTYLFGIAALLSITIAMSSCTGDQNQLRAQTKTTAEHANSEMFNGFNNKDPQFLINATEISQEEIYLGHLAQQTSHIIEVKNLGARMQDTHIKLQNDIKALAVAKNNTLQTSMTDSTKDNHRRLKHLEGDEFDQEYCMATINSHNDAIALYEKGYKESTDADMKQFINSGLVTLRQNLASAVACQNGLSRIMVKH